MDAWPYTGRPLPLPQQRFAAESLGSEILHGEETTDGIFLCAASRPNRAGFTALHEQFRRRRVYATLASAFRDLLVGLVGPGGACLGLGLLQGIDFARAVFPVLTPVVSAREARQLWFGRIRVRPDGTEIERLRPGEM